MEIDTFWPPTFVVCSGLEPELIGKRGDGLSPSASGDVDTGSITEVENDKDGSSKDTVCGAFAFTNFPCLCLGVTGLLFGVLRNWLPTRCCRSSSMGETS